VDAEIWGLMMTKKTDSIWVGATGGVCQFSGVEKKFMPLRCLYQESKMHNQCYLTNWFCIEDKNGNKATLRMEMEYSNITTGVFHLTTK
jgi:hypothetical protein